MTAKPKRLKILIIPMLPTFFGRRYQLAKHLAKNHEVHLLTWTMPYPFTLKNLSNSLLCSWKKSDYKKDGIIIHKIRRLPFFMPPINRSLFRKQVREINQKYKLDGIISQSFFNETEPPEELPLYFDYNDDYPMFAKIYGSLLYKFAYTVLGVNKAIKEQLKRARAVFAVSSLLEDKASQLNPRVFKIPNGVDDILIDIATTNQDTKFKKHSISYVSTFGRWSQILPLIDVVADMKHEFPDIHLTLVGDGSELLAARQLIKSRS